jgi:hypothetical protein
MCLYIITRQINSDEKEPHEQRTGGDPAGQINSSDMSSFQDDISPFILRPRHFL